MSNTCGQRLILLAWPNVPQPISERDRLIIRESSLGDDYSQTGRF